MGRPRKDEHERRKRWDALYVSTAEREEVAAAAAGAGLSVSQYLIAAHRGSMPRYGTNTAGAIPALVQAQRELDTLSRVLHTIPPSIDVVTLQAQLLAIERSFRQAVMPWSLTRSQRL